MSGKASLDSFAQEHGTTDSIREETDQRESEDEPPVDIPSPEPPLEGAIDEEYIHPDRHVNLDHVPEYWQRNADTWNLIPLGEFVVIFDETSCQHGWPNSNELQTGVYLRGRHQSNPPAPVEVDDDLLRGVATTAVQAAHKIVSEYDLTDAPVVGVTKECGTSLSIYLDTGAKPRMRRVYDKRESKRSALPTTIPETDDSPPLFHGFSSIRLFNKGTREHEIYVEAEEPRLSIADIGWTKMLNRSF